MNKKQALHWTGKEFRTRPGAIRMTEGGQRLEQRDETWLVGDVSDIAATISNVSTGQIYELGLDNIREFRTPDFLLLRCQLTIKGEEVVAEPVVITTVDRTISGFEALLARSWVRENIGNRDVWISEVDNMFQIECGNTEGHFYEEWTSRFPDRDGSWAFPVRLTIQGVEVKELGFVSCDGGRITVPIPRITKVGDQRGFAYDRDSLPYKVGQVVGQFYIYETLDAVARRAGIDVA